MGRSTTDRADVDRFERIAGRLRDERGMALILAVGISLVLGIVATSAILYSTTNEQEATRGRADLRTYQLAQSGVDAAVSQLSQATQAELITATYISGKPAADRTITTNNGTVTWDGQLFSTVSGTITRYTWRLTSVATTKNPAAPGNITRTVTADLKLRPRTSQTVNAQAWRYVYSKKTGTPGGCDEIVYNNTSLRASMYVAGNLCFQQSTQIIGPDVPATDPPVELIVMGTTDLNQNNAFVGYDKNPPQHAQPLTDVWFNGGCRSQANSVLHFNCNTVDNVWGLSDVGPTPPYETSKTGHPAIPGPAADFPAWYDLSSPGPHSPCDPTVSTGSYPTFDNNGVYDASAPTWDIAPATAYYCWTPQGSLRWTPGTRVLEITGTIFYDGDAEIDGDGTIDYTGIGAIYLSGSFFMRQSKMCGNTSGSNCNFAGWNYVDNILVIVTAGSGAPASDGMGITLDQSTFQGALYAATNIEVSASSNTHGPMVALQEIIRNNSDTTDFPIFVRVPFGTPGNVITEYDITAPTHYQG